MSRRIWALAVMVAVSGAGAGSACASEMVYHPVNPTFGGSSLNGTFLLSTAQTQGEGVKSGQQGPDLSSLSNALSGLGSAVIIGGSGTSGGSGGTGSTGSTGSTTTNSARVP